METIRAVDWSPEGDAVRIIDQRRLPGAFVERDLTTLDEICDAIRTLAVRGAPAIGVAGAMGMVVALSRFADEPLPRFLDRVRFVGASIRATRPTAVNLPWAVERMLRRVGFDYAGQIDPFDGGPHFVAQTDQISVVRDAREAKVRVIDASGPSWVVLAVDRVGGFRATPARVVMPTDDDPTVGITEDMLRRLGIAAGDTLWMAPG